MVNESYCEPICLFKLVGDEDFECINAKCTAPNECECYEGFHQVSDFQCEPTCSSCENGDCLAPEVCECKDGYEKSSDGVCMPVCDPSCINGNCIGPNVCKCNENFEKYLRSHECLEKQLIKDRQSCENSCQNGTCSDDGTCGCDFEFEMYNDKCLKKCDKKCTNGKCLEDQCICPENYKLSENTTECLPICAFEDGHDCISGVCVAPQTCKCFEGYKFLDARNCTCVPMCNPMCINSICLAEDGCQCHDDFYKISDYECIKNCSIGFKWVHDECMEENLGFESSENEDGLMIFDEEKTTTTEAVMASYEETSESSENDVESSTDDNDEEEGSSDDTSERSSDDTNDTTERFVQCFSIHVTLISFATFSHRQTVMVQKSLQQLIPTTLCIILLSIIFILIISILTTFCFLYRRVNPKNIYYVNQQGKKKKTRNRQLRFTVSVYRKIFKLCVFYEAKWFHAKIIWRRMQFMRKAKGYLTCYFTITRH